MAGAARGARATGLLAVAFALAAALFDSEPLWVPAATLALLAAGSTAWVGLGARGVRITRTLGARRVMEDEPVAIVLDVSAGGWACRRRTSPIRCCRRRSRCAPARAVAACASRPASGAAAGARSCCRACSSATRWAS